MKETFILLLVLYLEVALAKTIAKRDCCPSNCVQQCTTNCQSNCNTCQSNCNTCQGSCDQCQSNCGNTCQQRCQTCTDCSYTPEREPFYVPFNIPSQGHPPFYQPSGATSVNNANNYNHTAKVSIGNVVNLTNNITVPITLNSTNENRISIKPAHTVLRGGSSAGNATYPTYPIYPRDTEPVIIIPPQPPVMPPSPCMGGSCPFVQPPCATPWCNYQSAGLCPYGGACGYPGPIGGVTYEEMYRAYIQGQNNGPFYPYFQGNPQYPLPLAQAQPVLTDQTPSQKTETDEKIPDLA